MRCVQSYRQFMITSALSDHFVHIGDLRSLCLQARLDDHNRIVRKEVVNKQSTTLRETLADRKNIQKLLATGWSEFNASCHDLTRTRHNSTGNGHVGGGWFIYDVAYYGVNLFAGDILNSMNGDDDNISSDASIR